MDCFYTEQCIVSSIMMKKTCLIESSKVNIQFESQHPASWIIFDKWSIFHFSPFYSQSFLSVFSCTIFLLYYFTCEPGLPWWREFFIHTGSILQGFLVCLHCFFISLSCVSELCEAITCFLWPTSSHHLRSSFLLPTSLLSLLFFSFILFIPSPVFSPSSCLSISAHPPWHWLFFCSHLIETNCTVVQFSGAQPFVSVSRSVALAPRGRKEQGGAARGAENNAV